jgi:two-component system OmpR family sensor kinase
LVEAAAELGPMAEGHALSIAALPAVVSGVRDELHRLVLNLLENAIRHTPPGTRIVAATSTRDDLSVLTVEDDGPGIPPGLQARVFERFVRGGRDGAKGSGLGLAIVRAVALSHGGRVEMQQPDGHSGTRFVIEIPAVREPAQTGAEANGADAGGAEANAADTDGAAADQTSTTTGRTMGRRRNRS